MPRTPETRKPNPAEIAVCKQSEELQDLFDRAFSAMQEYQFSEGGTSKGSLKKTWSPLGGEFGTLWTSILQNLTEVGKKYPVGGDLNGMGYESKGLFVICESCPDSEKGLRGVQINLRSAAGRAWLSTQDGGEVTPSAPFVVVPTKSFKMFCQNERREIGITIGESGLVKEMARTAIDRDQNGFLCGSKATALTFKL